MGEFTVDDAIAFIVEVLKRPTAPDPFAPNVSGYGYDLYIPHVLNVYLRNVEQTTEQYPSHSPRGISLSPTFYEATWQLCRLGVLRPGIRNVQGQSTADGSSGNGYSLTQVGQTWLAKGTADAAILQIGSLTTLFLRFGARLGTGFVQRSAEAVSCHRMGAYLACCAMCGAGAESILLAVAIAKENDEGKVLSAYRAASGRKRVTDMVVAGLKVGLASPFSSATGLLSYWRDDAAHGIESTISEIEAHEALGRLLRFAQFATDHWTEITGCA